MHTNTNAFPRENSPTASTDSPPSTAPLLQWHAPQRQTHARSEKWYLIGGVITSLFIGYGILTGAWSLSIVFGTIAGLYFLLRSERHRDHTLTIYDTGVEFDGALRKWADCREFWILEGAGYHELHIASARKWTQDIVIQTGDTDPYLLRDLLGQYIPQTVENHEKFVDWLIRSCKL